MTRTERETYWRGHVEAATSHPESLAAYCRETELCYQSLLVWKRRFASASRFIELEAPVPESFSPVLLTGLGRLRIELPCSCPPGWAAAFVASLSAALEPLAEEAKR